MAEVVAFLIRFDLAPVSLSSKQLREIGEKHARNLHIWEIGYACVGSRWVHMQCDFVFTHQEREERFTYDIDSAKEIIPIAMRNVVVEECYFECLYGVEERGCILGAHGEIADRIVVTSSLGVLGRCFDSTERLLAFVAKFRSIKVGYFRS